MNLLEETHLEQLRNRAVMLYGPDEINAALDRMAAGIETMLEGTLPVVLVILTGGIIPAGHLLTRLRLPLEIDYLHATRYRGETTGAATIDWLCEPRIPLAGRTVLIVDDILDEGHTLKTIIDHCRQAGALRTCTAVLVEKRHERRTPEVAADFVGLEVADRYVFGFGMDYKGYLRNLNGIFTLDTE
jgi:hypoxanthine phosphoribosyltransferase